MNTVRINNKLIAAAASMLLFSAQVQADETIAFKAGAQLLSPSGQFGTSLTNADTRIDMNSDLNFDNSLQPNGEIDLLFGDTMISFGLTPVSFKGSGVLTRTISYNGSTFAAGTSATSQFNADIFDFGYTWYFINMDDLPSRFQLGFETSVKTISAKTKLGNGVVNASRNVTVAIPTAGLRGRVALADFVGLTGRVGYLGYAGNSFLDFDGQVEFSPLPALGIYAGYRQITLKLDSSFIYADTTFSGPYAGAFARF